VQVKFSVIQGTERVRVFTQSFDFHSDRKELLYGSP
jgi:hypothetical protein